MQQKNHLQQGSSTLGSLMFFGSILIIVACLISYGYNRAQISNHPFKTVFSAGQNLSTYGYNFLPPWSGFEITVLVVGGIGFLLMSTSSKPSNK